MNKLFLSVIFMMISYSVMAELDVVDESHSYAYNEGAINQANREKNNASFVASDNEQRESLSESGEEDGSKLQLLFSKIENLQQELSELRGRVEVQAHQLEVAGLATPNIKKGHKPTLTDTVLVAPKVIIPETALSTPHLVAPTSSEAPVIIKEVINKSSDPMDEQLSYVGAYELVKHSRYQEAIPAMRNFITTYPDGPYVANAHYWLGELYGVKGNYDKALLEFNVVINDFSDSNKLAAAQYKRGITYEKIGKMELAQSDFLKVTEAFPGTAVARLAKAKLK